MNMIKLFAAAVAAIGIASSASALTVIDFESDTTGGKANGFMSDDSGVVAFTDTMGADLVVSDFCCAQSDGRALGVFGDDASQLQMDFAVAVAGLMLDFGNDDPGFSNPGDTAWLVGWLGGAVVETVGVVMNRDDIMNQTIGLTMLVDQAFFYYGDAAGRAIGLIEVVDNIKFTAVPLPAGLVLLLSGLFGLGIVARRRRTMA